MGQVERNEVPSRSTRVVVSNAAGAQSTGELSSRTNLGDIAAGCAAVVAVRIASHNGHATQSVRAVAAVIRASLDTCCPVPRVALPPFWPPSDHLAFHPTKLALTARLLFYMVPH